MKCLEDPSERYYSMCWMRTAENWDVKHSDCSTQEAFDYGGTFYEELPLRRNLNLALSLTRDSRNFVMVDCNSQPSIALTQANQFTGPEVERRKEKKEKDESV